MSPATTPAKVIARLLGLCSPAVFALPVAVRAGTLPPDLLAGIDPGGCGVADALFDKDAMPDRIDLDPDTIPGASNDGTACLPVIPADFDGDGDVDQMDFDHFQACSSGASVPQNEPTCADAELDGDDDVDQADFGFFQRCLSGADVPADPNCAPPRGMSLIPGGEFQMGDHYDMGREDEKPIHLVDVDSFYMDACEVTNQQYADYLNCALSQGLIEVGDGVVYALGGSDPYCDTHSADGNSRIHFDGGTFTVTAGKEDHPMVRVSWFGAAAYTNWLSTRQGRQPCYDLSTWACDFGNSGYRLATEAEWEYAARGGLNYKYPWGNEIDGSHANYRDSGDPYETVYPFTTPVGYYNGNQTPPGSDMANGYGLYDVAGNTWEWCHDWYDAQYYSVSPYSNPPGPAAGTTRILRGGAWNGVASVCRTARRAQYLPGTRGSGIGFRSVLNAP